MEERISHFKKRSQEYTSTRSTKYRHSDSYDTQAFVDTTNATTSNNIATLIDPQIQSGTPGGSVKAIFLTAQNGTKQQLLTTTDFLAKIGASTPQLLVTSFANTYMLGTYQLQTQTRSLICF